MNCSGDCGEIAQPTNAGTAKTPSKTRSEIATMSGDATSFLGVGGDTDDKPPQVPERRCEKCISSSSQTRNGLRPVDLIGARTSESSSIKSADVNGIKSADVNGIKSADVNGIKSADVNGIHASDGNDLRSAIVHCVRLTDLSHSFNNLESGVSCPRVPVTQCQQRLGNLTLSLQTSDDCETTHSPDHGDDMDGYFQANLHLLEYLSNDGRQEGGGGGTTDQSPLYSDICDDHSSSDGEFSGDAGFHAPHLKSNNIPGPDGDADDQGDFIETDIAAPYSHDFLNSGSDIELSDDENQCMRKLDSSVYEFHNMNHDRHKKETLDKVFQSFERNRWSNDFEPIRPVFQMEIPSANPESISLWSPEIEYPELNSTDGSSASRAHDSMNIGVVVAGADVDADEVSDLEDETFNISNIPNNLNEVFSSEPSSDHDDELFNVSRQTSTSNFDNDENSFQGDEGEVYDRMLLESETEERHYEGEVVFHHCKRREDDPSFSRRPYSRLLEYDPSISDEEHDAAERVADDELFVSDVGDSAPPVSPNGHLSPPPENGAAARGQVGQNIDLGQNEVYRSLAHRRPYKPPIPKVMVWSEYEAYISQVKQIGRSACGPTAVINVMKAFDVFCDKDRIKTMITTNLRADKAPLPEYLISRSVAGTTAERLVEGVMKLTDGAIYGRFFCFYPQCKVDLTRWLGYWISKGAVPMVTLNLQKAVPPGWVTPDAWHHQMVYGVGSKGVYLTNPLEILPVPIIEQQLCSESILLVRRSDVLARCAESCDLRKLGNLNDPRWNEFNVLGQVVSVLREAAVPGFQGYKLPWTSHIRIPCVYRPGVSLFVKADSDSYRLLIQADPLPTMTTDQTEADSDVTNSSSSHHNDNGPDRG